MTRSALIALLAMMPPPARASDRSVRMLVLGDSLALATGASRPDGGFIFPAFRELLREHPGSRLDDVAMGGSTVADVLRLQAPRVADSDPDIVVICVGGNDVVRGTPSYAFARAYRELLGDITRSAPRARLVCCGVPDVAQSPLFSDQRAVTARRSAADDAAVRAAALAAGARFVDFYTRTAWRGVSAARFFARDRFHPSDDGYAVLRAAFVPVLRAAADETQ